MKKSEKKYGDGPCELLMTYFYSVLLESVITTIILFM